MGNCFSISCNPPVICTINATEDVRYVLCPARESEDLRCGMESLRRKRGEVETRIGELNRYGVKAWIDAVNKLDGEVTELRSSLNRRAPCFRLLCCCCYPWNYVLGQKVRNKLRTITDLTEEYKAWRGDLFQVDFTELLALKNDVLSSVDEQIISSREQPKVISNMVSRWVQKVDSLATRREHCSYITDSEEGELFETIRALISEGREFRKNDGNLLVIVAPQVSRIPESFPEELVGVEDNISKVFEYLNDDQVRTIGIYGMGGAGKTTLALEVMRRLKLPRTETQFDLVIFAVVSQTPNILNIQQQIAVGLGFSKSNCSNDNARGSSLPLDKSERAKFLRDHLSKKRFLLILDDVWNELNLSKIGISLQGNSTKSKVLLTTRDSKCLAIRCDEMLNVGNMGDKDSWGLFRRMLRKDEEYFEREEEIRKIAKYILSKCGGLPLVIKTVGCALATTSSIQGWRDVQLLMHSTLYRSMVDVFKLLKFSFDNLEMDEYKSCLLFCALYPEDLEIPIEELIKHWIGEGLLEFTRQQKLSVLKAVGREIISILLRACLLEKGRGERHVKMHDSIRDMAIWLGKGGGHGNCKHKFLSSGSGEKHVGQAIIVDDTWKDVERVCNFIGSKMVISDGISSAFFSLRTLLFGGVLHKGSLVQIPRELFSYTPNLLVLDLSQNEELRSLPKSLWSLKFIRYLNLSGTGLERIPEGIGSLTSLQFLYLAFCKYIKEVPMVVKKLKKLVVLDLSYKHNNFSIPYHAISSLSFLQILDLCGIRRRSSDGGGIKDLNNLVMLSSLSLTVYTLEDVKEIRECHVLAKCIRCLQLRDVENLTAADLSLLVSSELSSLKELAICNCNRLEGTLQLPSDSLQNLETLELINLPMVSRIVVVQSECQLLPKLRSFGIFSCHRFRDLGCILPQLPNLQILYLHDCKGMVELIPSPEKQAAASPSSSMDQTDPPSFPKLMFIRLYRLPNLESISKVHLHLPSLQEVAVVECPKLREFMVIESEKTVTIRCERQWREQLPWEDGGGTAQDKFRFQMLEGEEPSVASTVLSFICISQNKSMSVSLFLLHFVSNEHSVAVEMSMVHL